MNKKIGFMSFLAIFVVLASFIVGSDSLNRSRDTRSSAALQLKCDFTCGTCGWRDTNGSCHNGPTDAGIWCCARKCVNNTCKTTYNNTLGGDPISNECSTEGAYCSLARPTIPAVKRVTFYSYPNSYIVSKGNKVTQTINAIDTSKYKDINLEFTYDTYNTANPSSFLSIDYGVNGNPMYMLYTRTGNSKGTEYVSVPMPSYAKSANSLGFRINLGNPTGVTQVSYFNLTGILK